MNTAAKEYTKALENRDTIRRRPPHDVFELQDRVRDMATRLLASRAALKQAVNARYGPTRSRVTRPASEGVYVAGNKLLIRRGVDGPSLAFWNVATNRAVYLQRTGRDWVVRYGPEDGTVVGLDEHWAPGGLRH